MSRPLSSKTAFIGTSECVKVGVRCRPLNSKECDEKNQKIVLVDQALGQITVQHQHGESKSFMMDIVFDEMSTQQEIYDKTTNPLVQSVLEGFNASIFAYGQTGTGKTFTMEGTAGAMRGIIPRAFEQIFNFIASTTNVQFLVRASFLEIYNDDVLDLLADNSEQKLELKENPDTGVYVKDLQTFVVKSVEETNRLLQAGKKNRKTGSTLMNRDSSRSHCVFCVTVESSSSNADGEQHIRVGKLNMVDLAGSEKQSKTGSQGVQLKEAAKINLSLSALGNVIAALTNPKASHVPYRDSKLTRLLQDSLGGNTKTVIIANIGPADYNYEETISTLRFATRAKSVKNKPRINEDPKDAMLREFQEEIARLKAQLAQTDSLGGDGSNLSSSGSLVPGTSTLPDTAGSLAPLKPTKKFIVEKHIDKIVKQGVTEEELKQIEDDAQRQRQQIEEQHARERDEISKLKEQLDVRQQTISSELKSKDSVVELKRSEHANLRNKLKDIESKMLVGQKIIDSSKKQAIMIEQNKAELARQAAERERYEQELRAREEQQLELAEKYESLEKEVESRSAKLEKLMKKYQEIKQDIEDVQAENQREREELLETVRELTKHIQLKDFILDNFVPRDEHDKIEQRAFWDDEHDDWVMPSTDLAALNVSLRRPDSVRPDCSRPVCEFAYQRARTSNNPCYRIRNIIDLGLDMPDRTTHDFQHSVSLDASLSDDVYDDFLTHEPRVDPALQHHFLRQQMVHTQPEYVGGSRPSTARRY